MTTTIASRPSKDELMTEFTIQCLKEDLQDKNDLIELHRIALIDEGNNHLATKEHCRKEIQRAMAAAYKGDINETLAKLHNLYCSL